MGIATNLERETVKDNRETLNPPGSMVGCDQRQRTRTRATPRKISGLKKEREEGGSKGRGAATVSDGSSRRGAGSWGTLKDVGVSFGSPTGVTRESCT